MIWLADPDIVDDGTLTPSTEVSSLPVGNLKNTQASVVWRTAGATDENVVIDAGSAMAADAVALANHNIRTGATVTLEANSINDFSAPPFSTSLTASTQLTLFHTFGSTETYRFWRLRILDPTNPDGYIQIGRLMIGELFDLDFQGHGPNIPWTARFVRGDRQSFSLDGEAYTSAGEAHLEMVFEFRWVNTTQRNAVGQTVSGLGKYTPFFVTLQDPPDLTLLPPEYVLLTSDLEATYHGHSRWSFSVAMRSVAGFDVDS